LADANDQRYVAWFHELDAWTEYWDVYHPETRGRYYFGDGGEEPGLLTQILRISNDPLLLRSGALWRWESSRPSPRQ
jgi:hypothetical protein